MEALSKQSSKNSAVNKLLSKLAKHMENNNWGAFADDYEEQSELIDTIDDLDMVASLNADYANALVYCERHRQAIPVLKDCIEWYVKDGSLDEPKAAILQKLNYNLAVAHFNLGDLKVAKSQFRKLLKQQPGNKTYLAWLAACDTERLQQRQKAVIYISLAALAASVFDIQEQINWLFEALVIIGVILILFNVYLIQKNKKAVLMK